MRSLLFMPRPQVALQTSHSPHSVTRQLLGAEAKRETRGTVNPQHQSTHIRSIIRTDEVHLAGHVPETFDTWKRRKKEGNSQHSSLTRQFSVSSVGRVQTEPSSGNCFTQRSREREPIPQDTLHGDQVIHSDIIQVDASTEPKEEEEEVSKLQHRGNLQLNGLLLIVNHVCCLAISSQKCSSILFIYIHFIIFIIQNKVQMQLFELVWLKIENTVSPLMCD